MRAIGIVVMAGAMCAAAAGAGAQETLPFQQGQWGIEADVGGGGGGLVRFVTARTALVLDLESSRYSYHDESGSGFPSDRRVTNVNVAVGVRNHRAIAPRVVGTFGVGVAANWSREHFEFGSLAPTVQDGRGSGFGPVVSFGGQYLLTDRFSAGVGYGARFLWGTDKTTSSGGGSTKSTNSAFTTGFSPLYVTLYF